jgi:hypothetical protein
MREEEPLVGASCESLCDRYLGFGALALYHSSGLSPDFCRQILELMTAEAEAVDSARRSTARIRRGTGPRWM